MAKLPRSFGSQQNEDYTRAFLEQMGRSLSTQQITFGDTTSNAAQSNMNVWKATGTTPGVADTEFAVPHQLYRIPWGYWVVAKDQYAEFRGTPTLGTAWTAATNAGAGNIFIRCNTATVNFVLIVL